MCIHRDGRSGNALEVIDLEANMISSEKAKMAFDLFVVKNNRVEASVTDSQKAIASEYFESTTIEELINEVLRLQKNVQT